jgi:hypothetical protein
MVTNLNQEGYVLPYCADHTSGWACVVATIFEERKEFHSNESFGQNNDRRVVSFRYADCAECPRLIR